MAGKNGEEYVYLLSDAYGSQLEVIGGDDREIKGAQMK